MIKNLRVKRIVFIFAAKKTLRTQGRGAQQATTSMMNVAATAKQIAYIKVLNKYLTTEQLATLTKATASTLIGMMLRGYTVRFTNDTRDLLNYEKKLFGESVSDKHFAWL